MDYNIKLPAKKAMFLVATSFVFSVATKAQQQVQLEAIKANTNTAKLQELANSFKKEYQITTQRIATQKLVGGLEATRMEKDGTVVALNGFGQDGTPLYYTTHADMTANICRADALYADGFLNANIDGTGMKVGVWDAGVALTSHKEFGGRVSNADNTTEIDNHTTMVTGNIVAAGIDSKARGVAYGAEALTHSWSRDKVEVAEAAAEGLLVSNHSYGITSSQVPDWYFGAYIKVSQDWDKIMYNAPYYLMVAAAGNAQNSFDNATPNYGKTQDGFDLLLGFTTAKNNLVVAGVDARIGNDGTVKKANVSGYSSYGPTDDGRIKPDLAGNGTMVYTTGSASNNAYKTAMGTSMAAPGVTGSLILLQQYHESLYGNFMKAATLKGLALHTADDIENPGPDYKIGWGLINTAKAAKVLQSVDYSSVVKELTLTSGETKTFVYDSNGVDPLMVSVSWTDPESGVVNRGTLNEMKAALVNDIDVRVTKNGETYFPWKLNPAKASEPATKGDNTVDPFEKIEIENASGSYAITISHKGTLMHGAQDVSLIVSGVAVSSCKLEAPKGLDLSQVAATGVSVKWDALSEDNLYEVQYKAADEMQWSTLSTWEAEIALENLASGTKYEVKVQSVCTANIASGYSETITFVFQGDATQAEQPEVRKTSDNIDLVVYPNPAVNYLEVNTKMSKDAQYSIINTAGGTIKNGNANNTIDVTNLESGIYIILVQDYEGTKSTKFYKS
ncbi:peptidase S8 [Croceivirga radicis]|uniref:Peptidase S8 n=1 Tax=Croceivirga radicis TaxID=1929488 RepID=A0A1V6LVX3_9FLAO|nr:S8 family serine peptidase [Croceivirga radicis]OQD44166.1 peptidase S8 [Croceivirga radicis]